MPSEASYRKTTAAGDEGSGAVNTWRTWDSFGCVLFALFSHRP